MAQLVERAIQCGTRLDGADAFVREACPPATAAAKRGFVASAVKHFCGQFSGAYNLWAVVELHNLLVDVLEHTGPGPPYAPALSLLLALPHAPLQVPAGADVQRIVHGNDWHDPDLAAALEQQEPQLSREVHSKLHALSANILRARPLHVIALAAALPAAVQRDALWLLLELRAAGRGKHLCAMVAASRALGALGAPTAAQRNERTHLLLACAAAVALGQVSMDAIAYQKPPLALPAPAPAPPGAESSAEEDAPRKQRRGSGAAAGGGPKTRQAEAAAAAGPNLDYLHYVCRRNDALLVEIDAERAAARAVICAAPSRHVVMPSKPTSRRGGGYF